MLQLHSFVNSALDGVEWLTFRPGRINLGTEHRCPLNRKLLGPQCEPGDSGEKYFTYIGIRTPGPSSTQSSRYTHCSTLAPFKLYTHLYFTHKQLFNTTQVVTLFSGYFRLYSGTSVAQWLRCCATVGPR